MCCGLWSRDTTSHFTWEFRVMCKAVYCLKPNKNCRYVFHVDTVKEWDTRRNEVMLIDTICVEVFEMNTSSFFIINFSLFYGNYKFREKYKKEKKRTLINLNNILRPFLHFNLALKMPFPNFVRLNDGRCHRLILVILVLRTLRIWTYEVTHYTVFNKSHH